MLKAKYLYGGVGRKGAVLVLQENNTNNHAGHIRRLLCDNVPTYINKYYVCMIATKG